MAKNYNKSISKTADKNGLTTILDWISEIGKSGSLDKELKKDNILNRSNVSIADIKTKAKGDGFSTILNKDLKDIKRYVKDMYELSSVICDDFNDLIKVIENAHGSINDIDIQNIYSLICYFTRDGKERYDLISEQSKYLNDGIDTVIKHSKNGGK